MAGHGKNASRRSISWRWIAAGAALAALIALVAFVPVLEDRLSVKIENAGMQLTAHTNTRNTAQVFMNDRWYAERNTETLLIIGVDESGSLTTGDATVSHQADFMALFLRDKDTGRTAAIHLNRDTMTDISTVGITGESTGTRWAQLALSYNYGDGSAQRSMNTLSTVEHLLYGIEIDHYITLSMDAVPIINDWAGGVALEILDDFTDVHEDLVQGEMVKLMGKQALAYVRTRKGLDDSSNLHRMERQRQYAAEWLKTAQGKVNNQQSVMELAFQLEDYYTSNCTVEQLAAYAQYLSNNPSLQVYEIQGTAVQGNVYMEFHVDESALQQLVLDLFYAPVYDN